MRYFLVGVFLILGLSEGSGQNLVDNGSFENSCPEKRDTNTFPIFPPFQDTTPPMPDEWQSVFGNPDFYHADCLPGSDSSTNNSLAFDGKAFMGIRVYGDTGGGFLRDYLHAELNETLDSGQYYRFSFLVKPVRNDPMGRSFGIEEMGMLITDTLVDTVPPNRVIEAEPQIQSTEMLDELNYWTTVCGVYLAQGGEKHITIGNFNTDMNTSTTPLVNSVNPQTSYYLVDFVEVVPNDLPQLPEDSLLCQNSRIDLRIAGPDVDVLWSDGSTNPNFLITEPGVYTAQIRQGRCEYTDTIKVTAGECVDCKIFTPTAFTPDGDGLNDQFTVKLDCPVISYNLSIFDRWGRKVFQADSPEVSWDGTDAEHTGVYTYTLQVEYEVLRSSKTEIRRGFFTLLK